MANERRVRQNFANGVLTSAITVADTALSSVEIASLPTIDSSSHLMLVLDPGGTTGAPEIVKVIYHASGSTGCSVVRGQEGTTARVHSADTRWVQPPVASDLALYGDRLPHNTFTDFNEINDFGFTFVQGTANGPGVSGAGQYYVLSLAIGAEYLFSQYVAQIAWPRNVSGVMATRYRENGVWQAWKIVSTDASTIGGYGLASGVVANSIALRDGAGDIHARLFRSGYTDGAGSFGYMAAQVDTGGNNYWRSASKAEVRAGLGLFMPTWGTYTGDGSNSRFISTGGIPTHVAIDNPYNGYTCKGWRNLPAGEMGYTRYIADGYYVPSITGSGGGGFYVSSYGLNVSGYNYAWVAL